MKSPAGRDVARGKFLRARERPGPALFDGSMGRRCALSHVAGLPGPNQLTCPEAPLPAGPTAIIEIRIDKTFRVPPDDAI